MLVLTPTMFGSLLAGIALWLLFWYGVNHVDSIPYLNQYLSRRMILDWIRRNPQSALLITEAANVAPHGISSASAFFFNVGGTLVNIVAIYGVVPSVGFLSAAIAKIRSARRAA